MSGDGRVGNGSGSGGNGDGSNGGSGGDSGDDGSGGGDNTKVTSRFYICHVFQICTFILRLKLILTFFQTVKQFIDKKGVN